MSPFVAEFTYSIQGTDNVVMSCATVTIITQRLFNDDTEPPWRWRIRAG